MIFLRMTSYSGNNSSIFAKVLKVFFPSPSITDSTSSKISELSIDPSKVPTSSFASLPFPKAIA